MNRIVIIMACIVVLIYWNRNCLGENSINSFYSEHFHGIPGISNSIPNHEEEIKSIQNYSQSTNTVFDILDLQWESLGPRGIFTLSLTQESEYSQTLYAVCYSRPGSIFKSSNFGESWERYWFVDDASYIIWSISADPVDPGILYVYSSFNAEQKFFKLFDNGHQWTELDIIDSSGFSIDYQFCINPQNNNIIYLLGSISGPQDSSTVVVFRTIDGGENWDTTPLSSQHENPELGSIIIDPNETDILYCSFAYSIGDEYYPIIMKTYDAGDTWNEVDTAGTVWSCIADFAIDRDNSNLIYGAGWDIFRSTDAGEIWERVHDGSAYRIKIDPLNRNIIYAIGRNECHKSIDYGETWQTYTDSSISDPVNLCIYDSLNIIVGGFDGVAKSNNAGETWEEYNNLNNTQIRSIAVAPSAPNVIYASLFAYGMIKSVDYGSSWIELASTERFGNSKQILVDPANEEHLFAIGSRLEKSTDGGYNWTTILDSSYVGDFSIYESNPQIIWAIGEERDSVSIYQSIDGGENWIIKYQPPFGLYGLSLEIAIDQTDSNFIYASFYSVEIGGSQTYRTMDGGDNWELIFEDDEWYAGMRSITIDPNNHSRIYGGHHMSGVYISDNYGSDWREPVDYFGVEGGIIIDPQDNNVLYAGGRDGIFLSEDAGSSWVMASDEVFFRVQDMDICDPISEPPILYLGTCGGGILRALLTPTDVDDKEDLVSPQKYILTQNYPNPFNTRTNIGFNIPKSGNIKVDVYNIYGQHIRSLVNQKYESGQYIITWDASGMASGIYFYRLTTGDNSITKRMTLLK